MSVLFSANRISKHYGKVNVLRGVSIDVRQGEIHALLGANGAGKSTLCKIISGLETASEGSMTLGGQDFASGNKLAAERAGVEIVQQELNLISTLSVAENLFLTRMPHFAGMIRKRTLDDRSREALDRFGLKEIATDTIVGSLGVGHQQMIEIVAALDRQCRLLILDEPTAALSGKETKHLLEKLSALRSNGIGMIYISHRLDEVAQIADRVTILRDGQHVCTRDTVSLSTEQMVELMSGEAAGAGQVFRSFATHETALTASGISGGMIQDVSFTVRRGERLGIAGLVGSGRTELLRLLFGADKATQGTVQIADDTPTRFGHPREAVSAGLAMVTEDRKRTGLLLNQSIRVNTSMCSLRSHFSWFGVLRKRREHRSALEITNRLDTKCDSIEQPARTLSGGNQQKVAVSKWLVKDADVFFFDEPTRGIDVASRRRLYQLFDTLAGQGKAIVIVSSDLDELIETCDRIGVMSSGSWVGDFLRGDWTPERIMRAAFSRYQQREAVA